MKVRGQKGRKGSGFYGDGDSPSGDGRIKHRVNSVGPKQYANKIFAARVGDDMSLNKEEWLTLPVVERIRLKPTISPGHLAIVARWPLFRSFPSRFGSSCGAIQIIKRRFNRPFHEVVRENALSSGFGCKFRFYMGYFLLAMPAAFLMRRTGTNRFCNRSCTFRRPAVFCLAAALAAARFFLFFSRFR